ncbi:MAG: hypothetical protein ACREDN_07735, partial [Aestuariivirga sp.]
MAVLVTAIFLLVKKMPATSAGMTRKGESARKGKERTRNHDRNGLSSRGDIGLHLLGFALDHLDHA